jgi:hypothetical protein
VKFAFGLMLWMLSAAVAAAGLAPIQSGGELGVRIDALPYPPTLPRELESGLTNRLYVRVRLLEAQTLLQERALEIAIRYDLWEQNFTVIRTVENAPPETQTMSSAELKIYLAALQIPRLFATQTLGPREVTLSAELLLNPIGREKLRMIRKWVAENSTPVNADQGIATSNTVFNRIFEQYADGSDLAAVWRVELKSPPFRPTQ